MEVKFFKAVYNEYDRSQGTGVYRIEELFDASELFEDHRFRYVEFAQLIIRYPIECCIG